MLDLSRGECRWRDPDGLVVQPAGTGPGGRQLLLRCKLAPDPGPIKGPGLVEMAGGRLRVWVPSSTELRLGLADAASGRSITPEELVVRVELPRGGSVTAGGFEGWELGPGLRKQNLPDGQTKFGADRPGAGLTLRYARSASWQMRLEVAGGAGGAFLFGEPGCEPQPDGWRAAGAAKGGKAVGKGKPSGQPAGKGGGKTGGKAGAKAAGKAGGKARGKAGGKTRKQLQPPETSGAIADLLSSRNPAPTISDSLAEISALGDPAAVLATLRTKKASRTKPVGAPRVPTISDSLAQISALGEPAAVLAALKKKQAARAANPGVRRSKPRPGDLFKNMEAQLKLAKQKTRVQPKPAPAPAPAAKGSRLGVFYEQHRVEPRGELDPYSPTHDGFVSSVDKLRVRLAERRDTGLELRPAKTVSSVSTVSDRLGSEGGSDWPQEMASGPRQELAQAHAEAFGPPEPSREQWEGPAMPVGPAEPWLMRYPPGPIAYPSDAWRFGPGGVAGEPVIPGPVDHLGWRRSVGARRSCSPPPPNHDRLLYHPL